MTHHERSKKVMIGDVPVGGGSPVPVQSMTNTRTAAVEDTVRQILALEEAGCEIVRCAVPEEDDAEAIREIRKRIHIPLVADIHFRHDLAIAAIRAGADKIRINPGNIGDAERVRKVVREASAAGIPIRVGVNSGSVGKDVLEKYGGVCAEAIAESALSEIAVIEECGYDRIVVSIKSTDVPMTIRAHEILTEKTDYPFHIGITEAGTPYEGIIRSAAGIGALLSRGIGDTLRVSLTGDPVEEVRAGIRILRAMGLRRKGIEVISCPTCGRTQIDLITLAEKVGEAVEGIDKDLKVAVMGCVVNGPGEAREADLGIAGGIGEGLLFRRGQIVAKLPEEELLPALLREIADWTDQ